MNAREITTVKNGITEIVTIEYEGDNPTIHLLLADGSQKSYTALDLFESFGLLRADMKHIKFLCKGSKINVHTSGMSSHMSNGLVAYELTMGQPDGELVHICPYEENDLTNDIKEQNNFCRLWADST